MKIKNELFNTFFAVCAAFSFATVANAKRPVPTPPPPPTSADLTVSFLSANSVTVYAPANYSIRVSNLGGSSASGTILRVQLPVTVNSPTPRIMGTLSNLSTGCTLSGTLITCNLGPIGANSNITKSFILSLPHAEKVLSLNASVTTTSTEANSLNNSALLTPVISYFSIVVGASNVNNKHCTGSATLTSYLECIYAPSSISEHDVDFNSDGTILIGEPSFTGNWNQISEATNQQDSSVLNFTYLENGNVAATFKGRATSANCFEGVTQFPAPSNYVSPYRVCLQP